MTTQARPIPAGRAQGWQQALAPRLGADVLCLVLLFVFTFAQRAIWFGDPVADFDEQLYSFIGWRMQFGEWPYVDWWDRKPFGLFAIFGVAHVLLGPGALAYQVVAALFTCATAWLTYRLARRLADPLGASFAAVFAVSLLSAYSSYSGQSEVFFTPLMLGMASLLIDAGHPRFTRRAIVAMLLGGLALQVKYTVLPQCLFFGGWALWVEWRSGRSWPVLAAIAAAFALAGLLPTLAVAAFYAAIGQFDAFWFANFESFFLREAAPQGRYAAGHLIGVVLLGALVAGGVYTALRVRRPQPFSAWLFFLGWTLATLATVLLPRTVYLYYYAALAAPVALVAVPLLSRWPRVGHLPALALAVGLLALLSLPDRREQSLEQRGAAEALTATIAPHVGSEGNCLWLWDGPTALYRLAQSCVPTRFVYPDHLNNALETGALGISQSAEVARILAQEPGAIVTANRAMTIINADAQAIVDAALESDYRPALRVQMHGRELTAWVRLPERAPAPATTGTGPMR